MDGYAVAEPLEEGADLEVIGEQPAGISRRLSVRPGQAIRIFTGAPLPDGAAAVIMQEDTQAQAGRVKLLSPVARGENIRLPGADLAAGQLLFAKGESLTCRSLGLAASQGIERLEVGKKPRVALLTTGSEIRKAGLDLRPGEIHDSNGVMLGAQLAGAGFPAESCSHCIDDAESLDAELARRSGFDAILVSGGASAGDYDFLRECLRRRGASCDFWRVAIKPGKPFLAASMRGCTVFGVPGNPVSAFVTTEIFVLPALRRMAGATIDFARPRQLHLLCGAELANPGDRVLYVRGRMPGGAFVPHGLQESHGLHALAAAQALARIPPRTTFSKGDFIPCLAL